MYKAKTLKMKLVYIIAAVAMLAMLIPAMAVPVSAQSPYLALYIEDPVLGGYTTTDGGYNVYGSIIRVVPMDLGAATVTNWSIVDVDDVADFVGTPVLGGTGVAEAYVIGGYGEATIVATLSTGASISVDKKWGQIESTEITGAQSIFVTWNESAKEYEGMATVTDIVNGDFINKDGVKVVHTAQGVILHWYLIEGTVAVDLTPGRFADVDAYVSGLPRAYFSQFVTPPQDPAVTETTTVSDIEGASTVSIYTVGEENINVVVVPEYPTDGLNVDITPEITSINFWTREMEKVPQVRWAGEKIVLEKNFGEVYAGNLARFSLENQSPGALEGIEVGGLNFTNTNDTVWTEIDDNGFASCILVCEDMGEVDVDVALYDSEGDYITNQHGFVVYFLKLESLTLGNVVGKRVGHDAGLWTPENPWDPTGSYNGNVEPATPDLLAEELNVSQDALLRARVKGWFVNANPSVRPEGLLDMDQDGEDDLVLPAGRWVLPDDWAKLAGPNWTSNRLHWDIMDNPFDNVRSSNPLGPYIQPYSGGAVKAAYPVVGPFSPGIELMTPTGWLADVTGWDDTMTDITYGANYLRQVKTVVPNGALEWWDAPMPPAKIVYEILNTGISTEIAGYFKEAAKTDIYYTNGGTVYTNPFYCINIPAHWAIPAFVNNGGYDWDTFGVSTTSGQEYGAYPFWKIINQPAYTAPVPSADPANKPTKVEVYSDNHGEAMVWLNGDWNLDLSDFMSNGAADILPGSIVGQTTVQVLADYPYFRKHQAILSNEVTKTWLWGGQVLGADADLHEFPPTNAINPINTRMVLTTGTYTVTGGVYPNEVGTSLKKMAWIWATDRDGRAEGVMGARVNWYLAVNSGDTPIISGMDAHGVSNYNEITENIDLEDGFLAGTSGVLTGSLDGSQGMSYMRAPTGYEADLFAKFWPDLEASDYVVAAIEIYDSTGVSDVQVTAMITSTDFGLVPGASGTVIYRTNIDFAGSDPMDDQVCYGDANIDGSVNMGDVTAVERIILGLDVDNCNADANANGVTDMGDVVKIERMILGY